MNSLIVFVIFTASTLLPAGAGYSGEIREHFVLADRAHKPLLHGTTVVTSSREGGTEMYLLRTASGQHLQVKIERDVRSHQTTARYSVNGGRPVLVSLDLPFQSTAADIPITIEGKGSIKTSEQAFKADADGSLHRHIKDVVGNDTIAAFAAQRGVFGFPQFAGACSTFEVVTGTRCAADPTLLIASTLPDCDFDASFGVPCSDTQTARAKERKKKLVSGPY